MRNGQTRTNRMQNCFHIALEHLEPRSMMAAQPLTSLPLDPQSLDGTGNNVAHPDWGSTVEDLLRRSPVAYGDSISTPSGADRPNARAISNALAASPDGGITNNRDFTAFVYAWGQFLDHDLSLLESLFPSLCPPATLYSIRPAPAPRQSRCRDRRLIRPLAQPSAILVSRSIHSRHLSTAPRFMAWMLTALRLCESSAAGD